MAAICLGLNVLMKVEHRSESEFRNGILHLVCTAYILSILENVEWASIICIYRNRNDGVSYVCTNLYAFD